MLTQEPQTGEIDRFQALCAELEEYEHLPALTPGHDSTRPITDQSHEDSIHESILAGLIHP